jgi:hypothetical protein
MEKLLIENFGGGLNTEMSSYKIPLGTFRTLKGVLVRNGSLRLVYGQRSLTTTPALAFIRYISPAGDSYLVYSNGAGVFAVKESDGTVTTISTKPNPPTRFVQFFDDLIFTDNNVLSRWQPGTLSKLGADPPSSSPTFVVSSGGNLESGGGFPAVRYCYTFAKANGVESNPSPISGGTNSSAFFSTLTIGVSGDSTVTARNIYRTGGRLSRFTLVGTVANNTTTAYVDNLGDKDVGTIQLNYARDIPPPVYGGDTSIAQQMVVAKSRLIFASKSKLYVSSLGQPDYFPITVYDPLIDGIRFNVDPDRRNPIVALGTLGSSVIIARRKNTYLLQGNDQDSFSMTKYADVGCIAEKSLVQCDNMAIFLGSDQMVYMIGKGENGVICLSEKIRSALKAVPAVAAEKATACFFDRNYHLCIPDDSGSGFGGAYYIYNFDGDYWTDQTGGHTRYVQIYSEPDLGSSMEILGLASTGFIPLTHGVTWDKGIYGHFGEASGTGEIPVDAWSGDLEFNEPSMLKRFGKVRVRGIKTPAGATDTGAILFYANYDRKDGTTDFSVKSYALNSISSAGVLFDSDVDFSLVGHRISWRITGTFTAFRLDDIEIAYEYVREGRL